MLTREAIPQGEEEAEASWERFLSKAAKGSIYAKDILLIAEAVYLEKVTGDSEASGETWRRLFRERFPNNPPFSTAQEFADYGFSKGWFPEEFRVIEIPEMEMEKRLNRWGSRRVVDVTDLVNQSILWVFWNWDVDSALEALSLRTSGPESSIFDSRKVVSGMLYLALTWPGSE